MATLTIRNLPENVRDKLRVRAAEKGRSTEAEVRSLLTEAVGEGNPAPHPPVRERVERLQAAFAPYRSPTGSVVDEFLAEKRAEALRDEGKWQRLKGEGSQGARTESQAEKLARARAIFREHVPAGTPIVDEFLAERRAMWGEG